MEKFWEKREEEIIKFANDDKKYIIPDEKKMSNLTHELKEFSLIALIEMFSILKNNALYLGIVQENDIENLDLFESYKNAISRKAINRKTISNILSEIRKSNIGDYTRISINYYRELISREILNISHRLILAVKAPNYSEYVKDARTKILTLIGRCEDPLYERALYEMFGTNYKDVLFSYVESVWRITHNDAKEYLNIPIFMEEKNKSLQLGGLKNSKQKVYDGYLTKLFELKKKSNDRNPFSIEKIKMILDSITECGYELDDEQLKLYEQVKNYKNRQGIAYGRTIRQGYIANHHKVNIEQITNKISAPNYPSNVKAQKLRMLRQLSEALHKSIELQIISESQVLKLKQLDEFLNTLDKFSKLKYNGFGMDPRIREWYCNYYTSDKAKTPLVLKKND